MVSPAKQNKVDKPERAERRFSSAAEILQGLRNQDEQGLLGGAVRYGYSDLRGPYLPWTTLALTSLRNQLTIKHNEPPLSPDDGRIQLVREWVEASPGAKELFDLWSTINQVGWNFHPVPRPNCPFFCSASNGPVCNGGIPNILPP